MTDKELLEKISSEVDRELLNTSLIEKVPLFYEPIDYINTLPGKKLRPTFTIISGLALGGDFKTLLYPAAAIEMLHNFSLVHDDIMDNDDIRRGEPTVHMKWDIGTAILAGDGLLGLAYRKLLKTPDISDVRLVSEFTEAMIEICEGQALDKMFETQTMVSLDEYLEMISKKTAVLIQLSCKFGGIIGGGTEDQVEALAEFGYKVGMGFQIQDDLLDILADEQVLGKTVGSDLAMNKKTIVSIKLHEKTRKFPGSIESVEEYRKLINQHDIIADVENLMQSYFRDAGNLLNILPQNQYSEMLNNLVSYIQKREK